MVQSIEDCSLQNISNRINLRRSQTSIPYIKCPDFLRWRAMHENACKGTHESAENCCSFLQDVNLERQHLQVYFCRIRSSLIFFDRGAWRHVCNTRTCTQKMSYFHVFSCISMYFLRRTASHFLPREKISCFREKNTIFPDNTRKIMCQRGPFLKDHLFRRFEENIIFP